MKICLEGSFAFKNLVDMLEFAADTIPDKIAFEFLLDGDVADKRISYSELADKAKIIATNLLADGSKPLDRVLLVYQPGIDFIISFFGCLYAKTIAVPVTPPSGYSKFARLEHVLTDCQPRFILANIKTTIKLKEAFSMSAITDLNLKRLIDQLSYLATDNLLTDLATGFKSSTINPSDLAFLQYTSGSTGNPKGVMVSHGNLLHNLSVIQQQFGMSSASQTVFWLPPYHDMGLIGGILEGVYSRYSTVLMSPLSFLRAPLRWLNAISHYRATCSGAPNFAYDLCVKAIKKEQIVGLDLSCWEVAFSGAEPIRANTLERFSDAFADYGFHHNAFHPCYGLAEGTLMISGSKKGSGPVLKKVSKKALTKNNIEYVDYDEDSRYLVSSGSIVDGLNVFIVKPNSSKILPEDNIGEICVAGPSVAQGYWGKPDLTEQVFQARLDTISNRVLRTSDLGFLKEGELYITGRLKDVIIVNGCNYYPQDIEESVGNSHPLLEQSICAAFSIEKNDRECLIVIIEVRSRINLATAKAIIDSVRETVVEKNSLQVYSVVLVPSKVLQITTSGKIQRNCARINYINKTLKFTYRWSYDSGLVESKEALNQVDSEYA